MEGKVIAITGGASGIGLATAKLLASRGAVLSLADISEENLQLAKKDIQQVAPHLKDILTCKCDVREFSQVEAWIKQTVDKYGKLDGACNLAGTVGSNPCTFTVEDEDEDNWNLIIGVNLTGVMHCIKAEIKHMKAGASIVNASSAAGLRGVSYMTAYSTSKHGVIGLTRCAAKDFGPRGIRVNAIAPGAVDTPMIQSLVASVGPVVKETTAQTSLGRLADPKEVATVIAFLLSDEASYVTGSVYEVDAGYTI